MLLNVLAKAPTQRKVAMATHEYLRCHTVSASWPTTVGPRYPLELDEAARDAGRSSPRGAPFFYRGWGNESEKDSPNMYGGCNLAIEYSNEVD